MHFMVLKCTKATKWRRAWHCGYDTQRSPFMDFSHHSDHILKLPPQLLRKTHSCSKSWGNTCPPVTSLQSKFRCMWDRNSRPPQSMLTNDRAVSWNLRIWNTTRSYYRINNINNQQLVAVTKRTQSLESILKPFSPLDFVKLYDSLHCHATRQNLM